jgi:hypothetical protein
MLRFCTAAFAGLGFAGLVAVADNCTQTIPRVDSEGNAITACDLVTPTPPSNYCQNLGNAQDHAMTDCVGNFAYGHQGCQMVLSYCQDQCKVLDAFNVCTEIVFVSAFAASTEAHGLVCPAQGPGGIQ